MNLGSAADNSFQPITNWSMCPAFEVGDTGASNFSSLGSGQASTNVTGDTVDRALPFGITRVTTLTSDGSWGRRWVPGGNASGTAPIRTGRQLSFGFWIKVNQEQTIRPTIEYSTLSGEYLGGSGTTLGNETLPANTWTYVSRSMNYPNPSPGLWRTFGFLSLGPASAGFEFKLGPSMGIVGSNLPEVFSDGNTPGWKWLGTPGLSTSVGYPYTLESIAGKPLHDASNVAPNTSFAIPENSKFTVYSVSSDPTPELTSGIFEGNGSAGRAFRVMYDFSDASRIHFGRFTTSNQIYNAITTFAGVWTSSLNTVATAIDNTSQAFKGTVNNHTIINRLDTTNSYRSTSSIVVGTRDGGVNSDIVTRRFLIYTDYHSDETMRRIQAWLARRYGSIIPDGY